MSQHKETWQKYRRCSSVTEVGVTQCEDGAAGGGDWGSPVTFVERRDPGDQGTWRKEKNSTESPTKIWLHNPEHFTKYAENLPWSKVTWKVPAKLDRSVESDGPLEPSVTALCWRPAAGGLPWLGPPKPPAGLPKLLAEKRNTRQSACDHWKTGHTLFRRHVTDEYTFVYIFRVKD